MIQIFEGFGVAYPSSIRDLSWKMLFCTVQLTGEVDRLLLKSICRMMVKFENINTNVNHKTVLSFLKSDTVISTSDYHCRLD